MEGRRVESVRKKVCALCTGTSEAGESPRLKAGLSHACPTKRSWHVCDDLIFTDMKALEGPGFKREERCGRPRTDWKAWLEGRALPASDAPSCCHGGPLWGRGSKTGRYSVVLLAGASSESCLSASVGPSLWHCSFESSRRKEERTKPLPKPPSSS